MKTAGRLCRVIAKGTTALLKAKNQSDVPVSLRDGEDAMDPLLQHVLDRG